MTIRYAKLFLQMTRKHYIFFRISEKSNKNSILSIHPWRNFGAKTKRGKFFVIIIILDNTANCLDGGDIIIRRLRCSAVVQGSRVVGVAVGRGEINRHREMHLSSTLILQQSLDLYFCVLYQDLSHTHKHKHTLTALKG